MCSTTETRLEPEAHSQPHQVSRLAREGKGASKLPPLLLCASQSCRPTNLATRVQAHIPLRSPLLPTPGAQSLLRCTRWRAAGL
jgi:hypothetical protein